MKIPQKIKYIVNDKEEEFDFYKFIKDSWKPNRINIM